jgi:hypothetical protein
MLQSLGIVLVFATVVAMIATIATTLFERRGTQIAAAALAGAWIGVQVDVTLAGALKALPLLLALFLVPLLAAAIAAVAAPGARERLLAIPRRVILGMNVFRSIGFLFVALGYARQLGGPFPYSAGIGDILVGLLAIPLVLEEPRLGRGDARLVLWNALGLLDLITAVALGVTSANDSPIQLIHAGAGSAAITQLPWSLIPLFLVPCFMVGHVIVFAQMRASTTRSQYATA